MEHPGTNPLFYSTVLLEEGDIYILPPGCSYQLENFSEVTTLHLDVVSTLPSKQGNAGCMPISAAMCLDCDTLEEKLRAIHGEKIDVALTEMFPAGVPPDSGTDSSGIDSLSTDDEG